MRHPAPSSSSLLRTPDQVLAFAHRGGALHPEIAGLENSMAAFRHAYALGYRRLETDVHATVDGVVIAFHDDRLDRVTDASGAVAERDWEEVSQARIGGREPVPSFEELLTAFPEAHFNVDLKSDEVVEPFVALLDRLDAHHRVVVGSFSIRRTRRFRRLTAGRCATSAHPGEVLAHRFLPSAVLARLFSGRTLTALQIPHRRHGVTVTTPGLVRRAHANGLAVHVWTIDDVAEMEQLLRMGVDGLMTDRTDLLKETLQRLSLWKDPA